MSAVPLSGHDPNVRFRARSFRLVSAQRPAPSLAATEGTGR